jgi:hypothetical protein
MVCEYLTPKFKKKLLEIAEIKDLRAIGYTKKGAYNAKESGIMSDERCEKLVQVLGSRAIPTIEEALQEFTYQVNELERMFNIKPENKDISSSETYIIRKVLDNLTRFIEIRPKWDWKELGQAFGVVLKGTFDKKDLNIAVRTTLEFVAMIKGSKTGLGTFDFASEGEAKEFETFANSLIRSTMTKLSVERSNNVVKVTYT